MIIAIAAVLLGAFLLTALVVSGEPIWPNVLVIVLSVGIFVVIARWGGRHDPGDPLLD